MSVLYKRILISNGNTYFSLFMMPKLWNTCLIFFQCFFSNLNLYLKSVLKNNSSTSSMFVLLMLSLKLVITLCDIWKVIYLYLFLFNDNLLILSHSSILMSSSFIADSVLLFSKLSLKDLMVLDKVASSAYIIKLNILLAFGNIINMYYN